MSIWGKAKAAVKRLVTRKRREPEVPPEPPPIPPKRPRRSIDDLVDELYDLGVAWGDSHGTVNVHDATEAFGPQGMGVLLRNQIQSTHAWQRGNVEPGRTRWFDRQEWMVNHLRDSKNLPSDGDVFFWYHSKRRTN